MKTITFVLIISIALFSCDFGSPETPATAATDGTAADSTLQLRPPTGLPTAQTVPLEELPAGTTKQVGQSQGLQLMVAPGMKLEDLGTFILVCSDAVVKDARCFTIERYTKTLPETLSNSVMLKNRVFVYNVKSIEGANQEIEGYLQIDSEWFLVKATDKDPTWIFPYLAYVNLLNNNL